MTPAEMKYEFLLSYNKITNFDAPGYTDREISSFLSIAQERYVKQHYHSKGNKYLEGYEHTEKRRKDLSQLTKRTDLDVSTNPGNSRSANQDGVHANGLFIDLPTDLRFK